MLTRHKITLSGQGTVIIAEFYGKVVEEFAFSATGKFILQTLLEVSDSNAGHAPVLLSAQVLRRKSAAAAASALQVDGTQQSCSVPPTSTAISENNQRNNEDPHPPPPHPPFSNGIQSSVLPVVALNNLSSLPSGRWESVPAVVWSLLYGSAREQM